MKYQTMPSLSEEDAIALEKSIRTHGIQVPVLMDEEGDIIDGHHRWEIGTRCGIAVPTETREGLSESEKIALSISLNIDRRQVTRQQKRDIIAASLKAEPEASNREHARRTGADDKTVQSVRERMESTAEIPQLEKTRGADGRERTTTPDRPVVRINTKTTEEVTETFDARTGEQIDSVFDKAREALDAGVVPEAQRPGLERMVAADDSYKNSQYITAFVKSLSFEFTRFDAERIAAIADDDVVRTVEHLAQSASGFYEKVRRARSGLRLIEGGQK